MKKIKVGILTVPFNNNYGGYLQAFALVTVLKKFDIQSIVINRRHNKHSLLDKMKLLLRAIIINTFTNKKCPYLYVSEKDIKNKGKKMIRCLSNIGFPISKPIYSSKELRKYISYNNFDVLIVGSDQVWRPEYVPNIEDYYFSFIDDKTPKIAYAASFGVENPDYNNIQRTICKKNIESFNSIGLRETSGINIIRNFGWNPQCPVKIVLDPTLLLTSEDYIRIIMRNHQHWNDNKEIVGYILDYGDFEDSICNAISKMNNKKVCHIIDPYMWKDKKYVMPSIEYWLCCINNASLVVTDSFHGTVFSILFNTPFCVLVNEKRGYDRILTLLQHFCLEDRIITNKDNLQNINCSINWKEVNNRKTVLSNISTQFLIDSILK